MDEFAQSREDNDLFADEFEPVAEPTVIESSQSGPARGNRPGSSTTPGALATTAPSTAGISTGKKPPAGPRNGRGGKEERRGGRGGNRGRGLGSSRYAQPAADGGKKPEISSPDPSSSADTAAPTNIETESTATDKIAAPLLSMPAETGTAGADAPPEPVQQPTPQQPSRPTAVRGDRTLTGGPAHKKLTEAELTLKMEKMAIINAQKAERFRLSEEDSAVYARKEKEMAKKRVEEQKNARAMDMERAKNRQRKLAAQGGREWDEGKLESDIVDGKGRGRSSEYVRGGHGGVIRGGLGGSRYAEKGDEVENGFAGRGRGGFEIKGRGNRGSRGGARGGKPGAPTIPTAEDFPELPGSKPAVTNPAVGTLKSPTDESGGDWAEEMATPVEDKKVAT